MMAGSSNMVIFGVLIAQCLPDLHLIGPANRPESSPRGGHDRFAKQPVSVRGPRHRLVA